LINTIAESKHGPFQDTIDCLYTATKEAEKDTEKWETVKQILLGALPDP
jgi:hypothetical protein